MDGRTLGTPPENERQFDYRFFTSDRALIVDGRRVWDYDWKAGTVDVEGSSLFGSEWWDGWFRVVRDDGTTATMDGSRLRSVHWSEGTPPPPLPGTPVDDPVDLRAAELLWNTLSALNMLDPDNTSGGDRYAIDNTSTQEEPTPYAHVQAALLVALTRLTGSSEAGRELLAALHRTDGTVADNLVTLRWRQRQR